MALPRALRDLVSEAAKALGRGQADAEPFARILMENWFDTPESLANCRPEELSALGIPLRFAQHLTAAAAGAAKPSAAPAARPAPREQRTRAGPAPQKADRNPPRVRVLRVRDLEPAFRARGSILGTKGRNVHHIQDQTGVKVDLKGESGEPMELVFSDAPSAAACEQAVQMGKDLLGSVYAQYEEWIQEGRPSREPGHIGGRRDERPPGEGKGGKSGNRKGGQDGEGKGRGGKRDNATKCADAEFQHGIEIVECDPNFAFRGKLLGTKGKNVRDIELKTGAMLQLKGETGEPMKLELGANSPEALQQAKELAEDLVAAVYADYDAWLAGGKEDQRGEEREQGKGGKRGQKRNMPNKALDCEFSHTLDFQECDPRFTLRGRVLGKGGSKLKRVEEATGARLELQGRDGEDIHLLVGARSQDLLDNAVKAAEELMNEVMDDYAQWLQDDGSKEPGEDGGKGRGKQGKVKDAGGAKRKGGAGKGAGRPNAGDLKKILKLKDVDSEFDLRKALRGNKCENLHHIQDATGATLWVLGEATEPVRLEISAGTPDGFESAVQMSKDLIKAVFSEYDQWKRAKNGDEPPAKRQRSTP